MSPTERKIVDSDNCTKKNIYNITDKKTWIDSNKRIFESITHKRHINLYSREGILKTYVN